MFSCGRYILTGETVKPHSAHVELEGADADAGCRARSCQADKMLRADVTGKQRGSHLPDRFSSSVSLGTIGMSERGESLKETGPG